MTYPYYVLFRARNLQQPAPRNLFFLQRDLCSSHIRAGEN